MKSWHDVLWGVFIGVILVWLAIEVVTLKWRVADLERTKSAFYLVETSSGKHLKLEQIK